MQCRVVYTPDAEADLTAIVGYVVSVAGAASAARLRDALVEAINQLATFQFGHLYDVRPWRDRRVMNFAVKKYRVFYWRDDEARLVFILRIIHGARNIDRIMSKSVFPFWR